MTETISKQDKTVHEQALLALAHHYKHGDSAPVNRLVATMPKSNRKKGSLALDKDVYKNYVES